MYLPSRLTTFPGYLDPCSPSSNLSTLDWKLERESAFQQRTILDLSVIHTLGTAISCLLNAILEDLSGRNSDTSYGTDFKASPLSKGPSGNNYADAKDMYSYAAFRCHR